MKEVQRFILNVFLAVVGLTSVSAIVNLEAGDSLAIEKLHTKKQSVIACGYSQSKEGYSFVYNVNESDLIPFGKPEERHSENKGEGNGCSHQSSVGALLNGGFNRKQYNNACA